MRTISPYINFNGKCREIMNFYKECMGGELELQEVAGSPMEKTWTGDKDQIFHAALTVDGVPLLMGSDMTDQNGYTKGNNMALAMGCNSEEDIQTLFEKLSEGGKVGEPLKKQFWGAIFGSVTDRYGVKWMLNFDKV